MIRYGWLLPLGAMLVGGGILFLTYAFARIPLPEDLDIESSTQVFDRHNRLIGTYSDEVTRFVIDTDKLPEYVGQAVVAAEDKDFYEHSGVSMRGIVRAAWANFTGGEIQQGGSTITQQYIKNAVLEDPERTITRKVKEAILAVKLERRYSKDEILGFYLNTIYLGRGAYGVEAAAREYFGHRHATQLTLAQAAYLASIIPSPETYQPDDNPEGARARRNQVLEVMAERGYITPAQAARASHGPVKLAKTAEEDVKPQNAAYFLEWLRKDHLEPEFGEKLFTEGYKIYTTLDLDMQEQAEDAISEYLTEPDEPQAALVSMTPSGEVRALVGGRQFRNVKKARGFNFATDMPGRQAGSAFKPFTLLAALEEGVSLSSSFAGASPRVISDPECYNEDGTPWEVANFDDASYGTITLDQATTNSVNTVYAQLISAIGSEAVAKTVAKFGFDREGTPYERDIPEVCSLSLGVVDVTPLEMGRAFAGFAARGRLPDVTPLRFVKSRDGECLVEYRPEKGTECGETDKLETSQVAEQNSVDVLNQTLTHVVESGTGTSADIGRPVAGKTGTSQDHSNAWFAGYTPQLATVVWMGYPIDPGPNKKLDGDKPNSDDVQPLMEYCEDPVKCRPVKGIEVTGGSFPAQIWAAYMREAMADLPVESFVVPAELPGEILNAPPPEPTEGSVEEPTEEPTDEPSPTEEPSPSPSPSPKPSPPPSPPPSPTPSMAPSPTPSEDDRRQAAKRGGP